MISRVLLFLRRITRQLWFRVMLISLSSLLALALAPLFSPLLPQELSDRFGREAVLPVLNILASGMLAVTTFSLNVMVSAYRTAASSATPRVYRLLLEDTVTQSALATFTGGFVYSLCAVILFRAGLYDPGATFLVFVMTVLIVVLIVVAILRWIDHLSDLGSMDHTLRLIETHSHASLQRRMQTPCLGGRAEDHVPEPPNGAVLVRAKASGFVRVLDMARLDALAQEYDTTLYMLARPGDYVLRGRPIAWACLPQDAKQPNGDGTRDPQTPSPPEALSDAAALLIDVGDVRSFEQDPTFGMTLMAETAQRALSPGVNDPGTAVEVMGRLTRLLWESVPEDSPRQSQADAKHDTASEPGYPNVCLRAVSARDLLEASFPPIARDGGDDPHVMGWLDSSLAALAEHSDSAMAEAAAEMRATLCADHEPSHEDSSAARRPSA